MLRSVLLPSLTILLAGCAAATSGGPGAAPAPVAAPAGGAAVLRDVSPAQLATVDSIMTPFSNDTTPGAVVAVVRNGELVFAKGYGMADLSHGVPFDVATVTNIGSTAKQFTAFGVLLLEQRGALSLDDDVRRHIPELPDLGATVTLRHLLTHTSGYREFINLLLLGGRQILEGDHVARSEIIEAVQRQPRLQNEPGAEFNYNNTGYGLLALVVERVTDEPFERWMAREVFQALGMVDTQVRLPDGRVIPRRAVGYLAGPDGFREARDIGAAAGAGGVYTTVADLARWLRNFRTAELGGPDVIRAMTTVNLLSTGAPTTYGLGLMVDTEGGLRRWQHGGGDVAHRSHFHYYPDIDAGYFVLTNHAAFPAAIPGGIARLFFGEHMTAAPEPAATPTGQALHVVPPATLDRYVGRYALDVMPNMVFTFTRQQTRLFAQATGQPQFELSPATDTTFTFDAAGVRITFHTEAGGTVRHFTLHQGGMDLRGTRTAVETPPDPAQFAGRYYSSELDTHVTISVVEDRLTVQHRRFGPLALDHTRDDQFSGPLPITEAAFERDAAGRVTGFRASAGGRTRDVLFERIE